MKRNLQFFSMLLLMIVGGASFSWADDASEISDANTAINAEGSFYKIKTTYNETTYYLKNDGTLTSNDLEAYTFKFVPNSKNGYNGFIIYTGTNSSFSNPTGTETAPTEGTNINVRNNTPRDYDTQVLYKESEGTKYAIKASAVNNNKWGCYTFWDVKENEGAVIAYYDINYTEVDGKRVGTKHYVWELESIYVADAPVNNITTGKSYSTLNAAFNGLTDSDTELEINEDQTLTARLTFNKTNVLTFTPTKDITIKGMDNAHWFLINKAGSMIIGNDRYTITFDGEGKTFSNYDITRREGNGNIELHNVIFENFIMGNGYLCHTNNTGGTFTLDKVSLINCSTSATAFINSNRDTNGSLVLKGYLNQSNCTGTTIYTLYKNSSNRGRIQVSDNSFTASEIISINYGYGSESPFSVGNGPLVVGIQNVANADKIFDLVNDDWGLFKNNSDLKITQAYALNISSANAATLVLPFEAKIPNDVSIYTLHYTEGNNFVSTSEIESATFAANTPVLINAEAGSYKFISTATSGSVATGSDPVTYGALTGVYETTTVPSGSYVLYADATHDIGFYPAGSDVTVGANRAYLTADGAGARLAIVYGDETNAIEAVKAGIADDAIYTLSGVRVEQLTRGIYVKNGKKFIVK